MWSPSVFASESLFSTTTPTPSPGIEPSPPSPKLWQWPSLEMNCPALSTRYLLGWILTLTPPAIARLVRPCFRSWQATWMALNEEEHIVSSVMLGPCRFRTYDTRLAMLAKLPAMPRRVPCALASAPNNWYSLYITPTYTPTWPARSCSYGTCRLARVYPSSSIAIQACCRKNRSRGSLYLPSRGESLKNSGSNSSTPAINPPHLL